MAADGQPFWSIGDTAGDQWQFSDTWFSPFAPEAIDPVYTVGESDPASDWPRFLPGPLDGNAGFRSCSATVVFDVDEPVDATLELHLNCGHGPTPLLDVVVNGHVIRHVPRPERRDRADVVGPPTQIAGWDRPRIHVPARFLCSGRNELVLRSMLDEEPDPIELRPTDPALEHWFGSCVSFGGLALHRADDPAPTPSITTTVTPLVRRTEEGPRQVVIVDVHAPDGFTAGAVRVGEHTMPLDAGAHAAGTWRVRLLLEPVVGDDPVHETVAVDVDDDTITATIERGPVTPWTVHVMPHVHLDIGYTDHAAKTLELHARNLDRATDIGRHTPGFRYSVDGAMVVEDHLRTRREPATDAVLGALRDRSMTTNVFSMLFLTGVASLEECWRAAVPAARLREQFDIPATVAHLTDVPSYSWAIPSVLADLGVGRFMGIQNHGRAANADSDVLHRNHVFVWEGPDGSRVLTHLADAYAQVRFLFADPPTVGGAAQALTRLLPTIADPPVVGQTASGGPPTVVPHVAIVGTHTDNEDLADGYADFVERFNATHVSPTMRFSTFEEFFEAVENSCEPERDLPIVGGDGGSYWEDGVGAHAQAASWHRRAQAMLPAVETLAALTSAIGDGLRPDRRALDDAWDAVLIGSEHTWSAAHSITAPHAHSTNEMTDWKVHRVRDGWQRTRDLQLRASSQLGELVTTEGPGLLVVNTLGHDRTVTVETELLDIFCLVDPLTGEAVDLDVRRLVDGIADVALTVDLDAHGYRTFLIEERHDDPLVRTDEPAAPGTIEIGAWTIVVERRDGADVVASVRLGERELLTEQGGLADVLHVVQPSDDPASPRGPRTTLTDFGGSQPAPTLDVTRRPVRLTTTTATPDGLRLMLSSDDGSSPQVVTSIRFEAARPRFHVDVTIAKDHELAVESLYVAFPFRTDDAPVSYDRQIGWVDPRTDHVPGACNDWFTHHHAVRIGDIAWSSADAPLFTFGELVRGRWAREAIVGDGLYAWVMNNHWTTNYPASQSGTVRFAFTVEVGVDDDVAAARFGRDVRTPPLVSTMTWQDKGDRAPRRLPPARGRLVEGAADVRTAVTAFGARDGHGTILRVQNLASETIDVDLAPWLRALRASRADEVDAVEHPRPDGVHATPDAATVTIGALQVCHLRLT